VPLVAHRAELAEVLETGPVGAVLGVVRWRLVDLAQWMFAEFRITIAIQTLSCELRAMALSQAFGAAASSRSGRGSDRAF
jgi:hypothetical protein